MKKLMKLFLAGSLAFGMAACSSGGNSGGGTSDDESELVKAAKEEGELVVYGSCEEEYLTAAAEHFEELYGIHVTAQRLSTGEVQAKIEEEKGNPSGDVWFGGTTDPYNIAASKGLLEAYEAENASHLISDAYRDKDGYW